MYKHFFFFLISTQKPASCIKVCVIYQKIHHIWTSLNYQKQKQTTASVDHHTPSVDLHLVCLTVANFLFYCKYSAPKPQLAVAVLNATPFCFRELIYFEREWLLINSLIFVIWCNTLLYHSLYICDIVLVY